MIHDIYVIRSGLCIYHLKIGHIETDENLVSGFFQAFHSFGEEAIKEGINVVRFGDVLVVYTPLGDDSHIVTLLDSEMKRSLINEVTNKVKQTIVKYIDKIQDKAADIRELQQKIDPKLIQTLISVPCSYLEKGLRKYKCSLDNEPIDEKDLVHCNLYLLRTCPHMIDYDVERKYDDIYELNEAQGYAPDNIFEKMKEISSLFSEELSKVVRIILLNLDKGFDVLSLVKGIKDNYALSIAPRKVVKILDHLEERGVVVRKEKEIFHI